MSLALTPAPLLLAIVAAVTLPASARRAARPVAVAALLASIALLTVDALPAFSGGRVLASFGDALPGVPYLFRADATGMVLAYAAAGAGLLLALAPGASQPRATAALLLCVMGSVIAALAGNVVMLFAGIEFANLGTFALLTARGGRPGRSAVAALLVEHAAALALLTAAANLQASVGTSDFSALPAGALTTAVAAPWALAGALRLIAPALVPLRSAASTASWAATAAVPTGAAVLLRMREASGGMPPAGSTVMLAAIGAAAAVGGAALAASRRRSVPLAGRGLCLAAAGPVVALAGFPEAAAATGVAAGLGALQIAVAASAAWERVSARARDRMLAAAALLIAGGLPFGFGATAVVLELSAALGHGLPGMPLVIALTAAAAVAAAASVRAAITALGVPPGPVPGAASRSAATLGAVAVAAGAFAAVVPGLAAGWLNSVFGAPGLLAAVGAAAVAGPAGGWAGGYFAVAGLLIAAAALAAAAIADRPLPRLPRFAAQEQAVPAGAPAAAVRASRAVRRPARAVASALPAIDGWLAQQPQMPLIATGSLLAVILVR